MALLFPALLFGFCCDSILNKKLHPKRFPCTIFLSALSFLALFLALHSSVAMIQGLLFAQSLIFTGYMDAKTQTIPDELCTLIFLISLIQFDPVQSLMGMVLISVPLWILGTIISGSVGGGDIKLLAACGAVLGPSGIISGTVFSLIPYLLFLFIRSLLHRDRKKMYAMAPWIGIGCFLAYLIN